MTESELMREAHGWVADCRWQDETDHLTDEQIRAGINRHYSGGWAAFAADCRPFVSEVAR